MSDGSAGSIYAMGAPLYRAAGWSGVLPLRDRQKVPLLAGFTGYDGVWPTEAQVSEWMLKWPTSNLGLRVEYGILVLDVDSYDGKTGGATLEEAEHRWGPLSSTYRSTSRLGDSVSGQRFYRVPLGMLFRSVIEFAELGLGHIDTIQPHLRVSAVWPSIHPNTGEVRSDGPEGIACWFIDTDYNEESFFVRHAYFLGANDPYSSLKTSLKAEIDPKAWETLHSDTSRPFDRPKKGRIAVKVINHLGDEVMKVFKLP